MVSISLSELMSVCIWLILLRLKEVWLHLPITSSAILLYWLLRLESCQCNVICSGLDKTQVLRPLWCTKTFPQRASVCLRHLIYSLRFGIDSEKKNHSKSKSWRCVLLSDSPQGFSLNLYVCVRLLYYSTHGGLYSYEWFLETSSIMSPCHPPPLVSASSKNAELGKQLDCVQSRDFVASLPTMVQGYASMLGCAVWFYYSQAPGDQLRQIWYPRIPTRTSQASSASILLCYTSFRWWVWS